MDYGLLVLGAPYATQSALSALRFAEALPHCGHRTDCIFFYQEGVYHALSTMTPLQDEVQWPQRWQQLLENQQTQLLVCIAAGVKRGLLDDDEAHRYGHPHATVSKGFELVGLTELLIARQRCDRWITFAA